MLWEARIEVEGLHGRDTVQRKYDGGNGEGGEM